MPNMQNRDAGTYKESNTQPGGRSGSETKKNLGPAARKGVLAGNPTESGGINRATRGKKG